MKNVTSSLLLAGMLALPASGALASTMQAGAHVTQKPKATVIPIAKHKVVAKPKKVIVKPPVVSKRMVQGPAINMQWGIVQVTIVVQGKKVIDIQTVAPTERARSAYINSIAVPMLRQEALTAQSANIYLISGATMTSEAFAMSLQSVLQTAKI